MKIEISDTDLRFLNKAARARVDVGDWLQNRPHVGLDITDVGLVIDGFDYMVRLLKQIAADDAEIVEKLKIEKDNV